MDWSDACDLFSGGLPVYTIVREVAEEFGSKVLEMDDDDARNFGRVAGVTASITTTLTTGLS